MVSLADLKRKGNRTRKMFRQAPPLMLIPESDWKGVYKIDGRRHYMTPNGDVYPSVTTFIKHFADTVWLEEWKAKIGEEEAQKRSQRAKDRGTLVHKVLEEYVTNSEKYNFEDAGQFGFMFQQIRKVLDRRLDAVLYVEHALYSDKLKLAGRVDLCGLWDGVLAIIDFKNKNRLSKKEDISEYFIQACTYAIMHAECYGVLPKKLVILCAVEIEGIKTAQELVEDTMAWVPVVIEMARKFHAENPFYHSTENRVMIPES